MDPVSWGPAYWEVLHKSALKNTAGFKDLVNLFPSILPCPECSKHFYEIITMYPPTDDYFKWTVDVHNMVNSKLGKRHVTYEEAYRHCIRPRFKVNILLILVFIVILYGLYRFING